MKEMEFGEKVRAFRESRSLTREEFCGDESELTVRQLMRIESGVSKPTLAKIQFIAKRLGMTLFELMPDYVELPEVYQNLKYTIIRVPDYKNPVLVDARDSFLTTIYDDFYDSLPEEEQLMTDTLRSIFDVRDTRSVEYGKDILDKFFQQIYTKDVYTANDLLIIRLFIEHFRTKSIEENPEEVSIFLDIVTKSMGQVESFPQEELFVLRDLFFAMIGTAGDKELYDDIPKLIEALERIMRRTQDFQKIPILKLVNWKYQFIVCGDKEKALKEYEQAVSFASVIGDKHLVHMLQKEWAEDNAK